MQNRGSAFSLDHNHHNALAPGKQSASTLMSGMLMKDGLAYAVYGSQGGEVQPQAQTAFITRLVDHGLDVQAALKLRACCTAARGGTTPTSSGLSRRLPTSCSQPCAAAATPSSPLAGRIRAWEPPKPSA